MNRFVTQIYDFICRHSLVGWGLFLVSTVVSVYFLMTLHYKEDISDFLPMDEANRTALSVYQDVSGANNIYAILSARDTSSADHDVLTDGVDLLVQGIQEADSLGLIEDVTAQIDMDRMMEIADMIYADIPLFLTEADYMRIDSLLAVPGYISAKVAEDKEMLLFPSSQLLAENMSRDPLDLFSPVMRRLSRSGISMEFETYDGYILSPDATKAIVIIRSASGASESDKNARLLSLLDNVVAHTEAVNPDIDVHIIGGPAIAVSNAERIRQDSMLAVTLSGILILLLLVYVFHSVRNILLILVSVGWGWLFAMGGMALLYGSVSIIVIGIASVILGIAVNYPLHLIDHLRGSDHPRTALREIVSPLVIGNITTVGAFLCVVPLEAPALHDLGIFSSLLLVGTIIFVLVFLPHVVKTQADRTEGKVKDPAFVSRLAGISLENHPWAVRAILLLTVVFAYFSLRTEFDSDMRNINYMTEEQKADFDYFNAIFNKSADIETAYLVSSGRDWQEALMQNELIDSSVDSLARAGILRKNGNVSAFLMSEKVQKERLQRWKIFLDSHKDLLHSGLAEASQAEGFSPSAFSPFLDILSSEYNVRDFEHFKELTSTVFSGNVSEDMSDGRKRIVQTLELRPADMERLKSAVDDTEGYNGMVFDVRSMHDAMARTLSDNFNYIGLACACIVFFFLWFSFGNAELAIASFIPMAVSWLWILGIMSILGIRFNIVNIILATFIFGQGDDYTIFMTEGLSYEYAYRRKLLASYKNSIIVSALIMFIGMGTLVFAGHPALRSLGQVIVVGMSSVVLMAYLFPPLIFHWLVSSRGRIRTRPVTLGRLLRTLYCAVLLNAVLSVAYVKGLIMFCITGTGPEKQHRYRHRVSSLLRFFLTHVPGVDFTMDSPGMESYRENAFHVLFCRRFSSWDSLFLIAFSPDTVIVSDAFSSHHILLRRIMQWGGFVSSIDCIQRENDMAGENIFSDRLLATDSFRAILTLSSRLKCIVRPWYAVGAEYVLPDDHAMVCACPVHICRGEEFFLPAQTMTEQDIFRCYDRGRKQFSRHVLAKEHILSVVYDRYRYKGSEVELRARQALRRIAADSACLQYCPSDRYIRQTDEREQGEIALVLALMYPEEKVYLTPSTRDAGDIIRGCADGFVDNVVVLDCIEN